MAIIARVSASRTRVCVNVIAERLEGVPLKPALSVGTLICLMVAGSACADVAAGRAERFPLTSSGSGISLRASTKTLTDHSASITVELLPSVARTAVKVILGSRAAGLSITPKECGLEGVKPPAIAPAAGPPYALPATPLCTFVVSTTVSGRYLVTITVEDSAGHGLLRPLTGILSFGGSDL